MERHEKRDGEKVDWSRVKRDCSRGLLTRGQIRERNERHTEVMQGGREVREQRRETREYQERLRSISRSAEGLNSGRKRGISPY